ncbi:Blue-light photoreceptor PHR2 [Platanthera guangdongensis]|uniref:Blue-light photoreceptor PHR2 n=1 Tax=Platanthera guangdongensis TaxID=2320717 RepID=A0ABR2M9W8_9ASPA
MAPRTPSGEEERGGLEGGEPLVPPFWSHNLPGYLRSGRRKRWVGPRPPLNQTAPGIPCEGLSRGTRNYVGITPSVPFRKSTLNPKSSKFSARATTPILNVFPPGGPWRPWQPTCGAAVRRCTLLWLRCDLRIHDNEALAAASNDSLSILPVYLFDPRDYGKSSSGFDKTGPYRATFLLQSVADLRRSLRARGSDLVVRIGRPETVLVELARSVGADAVYMHREVSHDEARTEERVDKAMDAEGVEVKYFWGSTLYHIDDLPFELENMPSNYGGFRERVRGLNVRKTIEALDQIKGLPSRGDVDPGEVPTLLDLGLNPAPSLSQRLRRRCWELEMMTAVMLEARDGDEARGRRWRLRRTLLKEEAADGKPAVNASLVGGETEALERLRKFAAECCAQPNKDCKIGAQESIYGANFSCKISPWLAMGSLSPRFMFEELKKTANRAIRAKNPKNVDASADTGMNWLMFELLWRDFFRIIIYKYKNINFYIEYLYTYK